MPRRRGRERWDGEAYRIVTDTTAARKSAGAVRATSDRYWRLQIAKDPQLYRATVLELGYRPARLRFLAQGSGPFTLAYGSRRAEVSAASACERLLADVGVRRTLETRGRGYGCRRHACSAATTALRPLPRQTPVRLVVLWSVLIVGVGLLVAMALVAAEARPAQS